MAQSFDTKAAAEAWASLEEAKIMAGHRREIPRLTVGALFSRYAEEVSAHKKGKRWEVVRLKALQRDRLASIKLRQLDTPDVSEWQKRRLDAVSSASVRRERNLLNALFNVAVIEWKWLLRNPFGERGKAVRRPKDGKARKRIASAAEIHKLTARNGALSTVITWALETGMRASEIAAPPVVTGKVATLYDAKNGEGREVPLSAKALAIWQDGGFGLTTGSISALFARRCDELEIHGLTFHDLRASAATRLAKQLHPLQLAKMFGWKDLKHALVYYRESAEDVAKLL